MKIHAGLIIVLSFSFAACGDKQAAAPAVQDDERVSKPAPESDPAAVDASYLASDAVTRHTHLHARQLDRLSRALAAGDLDATRTPAYWLSRHEDDDVFPAEWRPYLQEIRTAALEIEAANDLAMAGAAAARIAETCDACHAAAGIDPDVTSKEVE